MKKDLSKYCINEKSTIKFAMESISKNLTGATLIINSENQVLGIMTDGDIRRALLKGKELNSKIEDVYNLNFKYVNLQNTKKKAKEIMTHFKIRQIPVLDDNMVLVDLIFLEDIMKYLPKDNYVFILAGGLGTRLRPLTETIPKPMLNVGDKPILERIIEQFRGYGFKNFMISINYKGEMVEEYFKDGKDFDVNIEYIKEPKKLGTAGSIRLGKNKLDKPFIVINGDILTGINFDELLNHHISNNYDITVGVRDYEVKIPYGVMLTSNNMIKSIEEKPNYNFYINSGVYVVNSQVISYIPDDQVYNMPDIINDIINNKKKAGIFPITEYWIDIGRMDDYKRANEDIKTYIK